MAKRARITNPEKWIKEGRGSGRGINYKPWLLIQDVSSDGRSTRGLGSKIGREYHFLSDLERDYFYLTEYSDKKIDIREQFPLLPFEEKEIVIFFWYKNQKNTVKITELE